MWKLTTFAYGKCWVKTLTSLRFAQGGLGFADAVRVKAQWANWAYCVRDCPPTPSNFGKHCEKLSVRKCVHFLAEEDSSSQKMSLVEREEVVFATEAEHTPKAGGNTQQLHENFVFLPTPPFACAFALDLPMWPSARFIYPSPPKKSVVRINFWFFLAENEGKCVQTFLWFRVV